MKKIFTLLSLGLSAGLFAQSFSVYKANINGSAPTATITNGGGFMLTTAANTSSIAAETKILLKNNASVTQTFNVTRSIVSQNPALVLNGTQNTPNSYFCFGYNCFDSSVNTPNSNNFTTLAAAGQTIASTIPGNPAIYDNSYQSGESCVVYFVEADTPGSYVIRYKVFNVADPNDTLSFTINYNVTPQFQFQNSYSFGNVTTATGAADPTAVSQNFQGASFGAFTAVGTSNNATGPGAFSYSGWPVGATNGSDAVASMTAQIDPAKYYNVTITPSGGSSVVLRSIDFTVDRNATGSRNYAVRSSLDSYAANISSSVTSNANLSASANTFLWNFDATSNVPQNGSKIDLSAAPYQNITSPVTFRFYSWNSEDAAGSFAIDNVSFKGSSSVATGIATLTRDLNATFKLYPNPSNDGIVTLESDIADSKIEVINILGSVVLKQDKNTSGKLVLDLNTVPSGSYFVKITSGNSYHVEKLIISK